LCSNIIGDDMKGLVLKPVLMVCLLAGLVRAEGSGDTELETFEDTEEFEEEGSGGWEMLEPLNKGGSDTGREKEEKEEENSLEYFDDVYPDYDVFLEYYDDDNYEYTADKSASPGDESVLRINEEEENDIEIRPRHEVDDQQNIVLETSQIFIMAGSAFVSFAIVMLTFFLCKKTMARQEAKKTMPFQVSPEKIVKEASIVKDYQKVPTTTKEFLHNTHVEMYRGESSEPGNPAAVPLV